MSSNDLVNDYDPNQKPKETHPLLSNQTYDHLKKLVQLGLPAFGALYFGLSQIWGLPKGEEVVGSIALFTTFLGIILGLSSKAYHNSNERFDGDMVVTERDDGGKTVSLELNKEPEVLVEKDELLFKKVERPEDSTA